MNRDLRKVEEEETFREKTSNKAVRQRSDLIFIAASFWFEESPCAMRTNTAGLGRLCMLFVLSTLQFLNTCMLFYRAPLFCVTRWYGACMSNSRYADTDRMKNVF